MIPVVTPQRMAEIDTLSADATEVLIERAGAAVAREAVELMGGSYGRRVVVLAGPGNNGADGRAAARRLRRAGARVEVVEATEPNDMLREADLYVDAAFGTGLARAYTPPPRANRDAPVLAVDIPSGLDGLTGDVLGGPAWPAQRTVTFAALKPGLLFGAGPALGGEVRVVDIGLEVGDHVADRCGLLTGGDIEPLPEGTGATHKWHAAALVVAGSPGMSGAAALCCKAAMRSGAGMVHLSAPAEVAGHAPVEVVRSKPPPSIDPQRFEVCAAGPGIGTGEDAAVRLADVLGFGLPTVIDADGLRLFGAPGVSSAIEWRRQSSIPLVLTPHDAELEALTGARPGADRIATARATAAQLQAVVLLKGGPTVVAGPAGRVRIIDTGRPRLATAGTGDVLTGIIAGRLAAFGSDRLLDRVAEAAYLHGRAAGAISGARLVAGDLLETLTAVTP